MIRSALGFLTLVTLALSGLELIATERTRELGIIDYADYYENTDAYRKKVNAWNQALLAYFQKLGLTATLIPVRVADDPKLLSDYKRVFIPWHCQAFSPATYESMDRYASEGGYLISNSVLMGVDADGNFRFEKDKDKYFGKRVGSPLFGVSGRRSGKVTAARVLDESPLSVNVNADSIATVTTHTWLCQNHSSVVLVEVDGLNQDRLIVKAPAISFKHQGRGVRFFFAFTLPSSDPTVIALVKNLLSETAREWQTDNPPSEKPESILAR